MLLQKLNLWREEFDTFDYNLLEYFDKSVASSTIKEDQVNLSKDEEREEENSSQVCAHLSKSLGNYLLYYQNLLNLANFAVCFSNFKISVRKKKIKKGKEQNV